VVQSVLANTYAVSGTCSATATTILFPWKSRQVMVINDSSTADLGVTFGNSTTSMNLKASETVSMLIWVDSLQLANNGTPFRVMAVG